MDNFEGDHQDLEEYTMLEREPVELPKDRGDVFMFLSERQSRQQNFEHSEVCRVKCSGDQPGLNCNSLGGMR